MPVSNMREGLRIHTERHRSMPCVQALPWMSPCLEEMAWFASDYAGNFNFLHSGPGGAGVAVGLHWRSRCRKWLTPPQKAALTRPTAAVRSSRNPGGQSLG